MEYINRNTDPLQGSPDGVEANINCVVTDFAEDKQTLMPCRVLCSYGEGTVGISVPELGKMIHIRTDEILEILRAAADAARELEKSVSEEFGKTRGGWKI